MFWSWISLPKWRDHGQGQNEASHLHLYCKCLDTVLGFLDIWISDMRLGFLVQCTDTLGGVSWFKFYVVIHLVPRQMQSSVSGSATTLIRGAATCAGEGGTGPLSSRGLYSRGRRWMNMTIQIVVSVLTTSQGCETGWQKVAGIRNWTGRAGSFRRLGRAYLPRKQ